MKFNSRPIPAIQACIIYTRFERHLSAVSVHRRIAAPRAISHFIQIPVNPFLIFSSVLFVPFVLFVVKSRQVTPEPAPNNCTTKVTKSAKKIWSETSRGCIPARFFNLRDTIPEKPVRCAADVLSFGAGVDHSETVKRLRGRNPAAERGDGYAGVLGYLSGRNAAGEQFLRGSDLTLRHLWLATRPACDFKPSKRRREFITPSKRSKGSGLSVYCLRSIRHLRSDKKKTPKMGV